MLEPTPRFPRRLPRRLAAGVERSLDDWRAREDEIATADSARSGIDPQTRERLQNLGCIG